MTNQIFKSAILDFSVSAQNAKANVPQICFNTQDTGGTAKLIVKTKKMMLNCHCLQRRK